FFTFQVISNNVEVYRRKIPATHDFISFAVFIAYFPKLVAGPIEQPQKILPQIFQEKHLQKEKVTSAFQLMLIGYFKKIVIADIIAYNINHFFDSPESFGSVHSLLITFLYTLQIYADFSAYTEIIRGVSLLFGINLTENFNQPYLSQNPREFWQRWHISLTTWLREYLYIPLGGNRKGKKRIYLNIMIVFILSGLWHGAGINFVIWGALHGLYLVIHRGFGEIAKRKNFDLESKGKKNNLVIKACYWFITFQLVSFAWIFFRAPDLNIAFIIIKQSFSFSYDLTICIFQDQVFQLLIFCGIILCMIDIIQYKKKTHEIFTGMNWILRGIIFAVMFITILLFQFESYTPFIYAGF
ncbi:MAG: hypothetical protein A2V66_15755, partial [Ignavibacteria bacterium RBG_13_36_8]